MKRLSAYMEEYEKPELVALSVNIDKRLKLRVQKLLRERSDARKKIGWGDLVEACLKRFCDEEEGK